MGQFDDKLPKPNINFRLKGVPWSFERRFSALTRYGNLRNLRDNTKAIISEFGKRLAAIRKRKGFTWQEGRDAYFNILKNDKNLTLDDKREVKKLIESYRKNNTASKKAPSVQNSKISQATKTSQSRSGGQKNFFGQDLKPVITGKKVNPYLRARYTGDNSELTEILKRKQTSAINTTNRGYALRGQGTTSVQKMTPDSYFINKPGGEISGAKGTGLNLMSDKSNVLPGLKKAAKADGYSKAGQEPPFAKAA